MTVKFHKYQGTGNDFVMIDNRTAGLQLTTSQIAFLCDRRFGIGADGLILLQNIADFDFEMVYFNSDGRESTMCGNGGRCLVQFAHDLGVIKRDSKFLAVDGPHKATINEEGNVALQMKDVADIEVGEDYMVLNTGSPHYVSFVPNVDEVDLVEEAQEIRYNDRFAAEGINVNFVEIGTEDELLIRTYERGVEDETLSCGTGAVAAALAYITKSNFEASEIAMQTKGGRLAIQFERNDKGFKEVFLVGPAKLVFKGEIEL